LESRQRRRRQARRRRDAALAPEDARAVRRGAGSPCGFLGLHRYLPLAPVDIEDSSALDIRCPLVVGPPFGALLRMPRLLRLWQVRLIGACREDKFLGRHRGGEEATSS
jgi:hypothetical protein